MADGSSIMAMAGGFIGLAILMGIGTMILGGSTSDCSQLTGAGSAMTKTTAANPSNYVASPAANGTQGQTGSWAHSCALAGQQAQSGYTLMLVALVVLAAAIVLIVVRLLSG